MKNYHSILLGLLLAVAVAIGIIYFWMPTMPRTVGEFIFLDNYEIIMTAKRISGGPTWGLYCQVHRSDEELIPQTKVDACGDEALNNMKFGLMLDEQKQYAIIVTVSKPRYVYYVYDIKNNDLWPNAEKYPTLAHHFQKMLDENRSVIE